MPVAAVLAAAPRLPELTLGKLSALSPEMRAGAAFGATLILGALAIQLIGDPRAAEAVSAIALPGEVHDPDAHHEKSHDGHSKQPPPEHAANDHDEPDAHPIHHAEAAPAPGLYEPGPGGPLPIIATDGRTAMQAYARPFNDEETRPIIALMITGLGLAEETTNGALAALPPEITLAFAPYSDDLQASVDTARAEGHEVVLELPMEPFDYPANDPGPHALLTRAEPRENVRRLEWLMARASGYFAVTNYLGARFNASEQAAAPVLSTLRRRGVALLNDGESPTKTLAVAAARRNTPFAAADRRIDVEPNTLAIDDELLRLEAVALQHGHAFGVGSAYPVTITEVANWARTLDAKGYVLAPVSAVLRRRTGHVSLTAPTANESVASQPAPSYKIVQAGFGPKHGKDGDADSHGGDKGKKGGGH